MSGAGRFREYRGLLALLVVLALLSPLGLYLPQIVKAGRAWGEWGVDEVKRAVGYAPAGMENAAGRYRAPLPDYAPPGQAGSSLPRRGAAYVVSGFLGIAACGGAAWLLGRWLSGRKERPKPRASAREEAFREIARARTLAPPRMGHVEKSLRSISGFFSRTVFREEIARRDAILGPVDPRARLAAVVVFLVSASFARRFPALLAHAAIPFAAVALSRIRPREFLGAGFFVALLFGTFMALPASLNLFYPGTVAVPLLELGRERAAGPFVIPAVVGLTREGLLSSATFLLRVLPSVAAVLWLTLSTRWTDLLRALRFFRLPAVFLQVAGMTVRYAHVLLQASEEMHLGKKSRTVCRAPAAAEQLWAGSRVAASWERSLHLMEDVAAAMKARGFTGDAKLPAQAPFAGRDRLFLLAAVLSCAGAHLA